MKVVSNTSPVMNLALIGRLDLLQTIYRQLIIPEAVGRELEFLSQKHDELKGIVELDWIKRMSVQDRILVESLKVVLDEGEAEAIALAAELNADLLLIDERRGRKICQRLGIKVLGLVGVLIEAKRKGILDEIKPCLDALINQAGFWLSQPVYIRALQEVGEWGEKV